MSMLTASLARPEHIPERARRWEDIVTALVGTWLIVALFSDGWAHFNVPELEGFFTPWHGALYSAFAAASLWVAALALRRCEGLAQGLRQPLRAVRRLPAGYPLAALGVLVFGFGGVVDLFWHTVFGVEQGIDALLSPSHLTLFVGGMLLLTAPVRGAWTAPDDGVDLRARFAELLSLTLSASLAAFFLLYASTLLRPGVDESFVRLPEDAAGHDAAEDAAVLTLTSYLVTTALLVIPLVLLAKRGAVPRGAVVLLVVPVVWLSAALAEFEQLAVAVAVTGAAVTADIVVSRLDALPSSLRLPIVGAVLPGLLWPAAMVAVAVTDAIRYPVALWTGVLVLTVLTGALLGGIARPLSTPRPCDAGPAEGWTP